MLRLNHLNGFGIGGGVAPLTSITRVLSAVATNSTTVAWPAVQAGDLAVFSDFCNNSGGPAAVLPSGFTLIDTRLHIVRRSHLSYRLCDGSESGNITGMVGGVSSAKVLEVFRGNRAFLSATVNNLQAQFDGSDPAPQTQNTTAVPGPTLTVGFYSALGVVDPRTFTVGGVDAKDGELSNNPAGNNATFIAWKIADSTGFNQTIDMQNEASVACLQSLYYTFT